MAYILETLAVDTWKTFSYIPVTSNGGFPISRRKTLQEEVFTWMPSYVEIRRSLF
jgi:hypothetical protein